MRARPFIEQFVLLKLLLQLSLLFFCVLSVFHAHMLHVARAGRPEGELEGADTCPAVSGQRLRGLRLQGAQHGGHDGAGRGGDVQRPQRAVRKRLPAAAAPLVQQVGLLLRQLSTCSLTFVLGIASSCPPWPSRWACCCTSCPMMSQLILLGLPPAAPRGPAGGPAAAPAVPSDTLFFR